VAFDSSHSHMPLWNVARMILNMMSQHILCIRNPSCKYHLPSTIWDMDLSPRIFSMHS